MSADLTTQALGISQTALLSLVRDIIDGEDLNKMTYRNVRVAVREKLSKPDVDMAYLKTAVKVALDSILSDQAVAQNNSAKEEPSPQVEIPPTNPPDTSAPLANSLQSDDALPRRRKPKGRLVKKIIDNEDDDEAAIEDAKLPSGISSETPPLPTNEGGNVTLAASRPVSNLSGEESMDEADLKHPNIKSSKKRVSQIADHENSGVQSSDEYGSDKASKTKPPRQKPSKVARVSRKRARVASKGTEAKLKKLKNVARALGLRIPPTFLKGDGVGEKCDNILDFLRTKGIDHEDPTKLSSVEIGSHRQRLEYEKDMIGIDESNIIGGGRSRRRAALAVTVQEKDDLPSDFSGPELSDEGDEDDGDDYAAPSDNSE